MTTLKFDVNGLSSKNGFLRILIISYEYPPLGGGGAKVVEGLVKRLIRLGHSVDIVTMGYRGIPELEKHSNLTIYRVCSTRKHQSLCHAYEMLPYLLFGSIKALHLARENHYHINHTHFIFPDSVISALVKLSVGLPFITTAHGSDVPGYNPHRFKALHVLLSPIWRTLTRRTNLIVSPSEFLQNLIKKAESRVNCKVIPNGIETHRFSPNAPKAKEILCVTRMFERKGVQYLIDAFRQLDHTDWKLVLVGDGPYLNELKTRSGGHQAIHFTGFIENSSTQLKSHYEKASVFVLPSVSENFPVVLLEAMTAGCAVITTRGTGCENVVGNKGLLVKPGDVHTLTSALDMVIRDITLRKELAAGGRRRVERFFSWQSVMNQYLQAYEEVIDGNKVNDKAFNENSSAVTHGKY